MYNASDYTIGISDAEGFGLSTLESLSCGTPIIATMTGGLQEQVVGSYGMNGIGLYPATKAIIGSQNVINASLRMSCDQIATLIYFFLGE